MTNEQQQLRELAQAVEQAQARLEEGVAQARGAGLSWAEVASPLGVTRQGAQQRYGRIEPMDPVPTFRTRQAVRHRGLPPEEPDARVWRVTRSGVWVTRADGQRECWHPDSVIPVQRAA